MQTPGPDTLKRRRNNAGRLIVFAAILPASMNAQVMAFVPNQGQAAPDIAFSARSSNYAISLKPSEAILTLQGIATSMRFVNANPHTEISGIDPLPSHSNYLLGNNRSKWIADVPNYERVRYNNLYPGIDLIYYGNQYELEYDLIVKPGADPENIQLQFEEAKDTRLAANGDLLLRLESGDLRLRRPRLYQEINGHQQEIDGRYVPAGRSRVRFRIAHYDHKHPLTIDPVLSYATYLGGSSDEVAYAVAADGTGNSYTAGYTMSSNFPATSGAYKTNSPGGASDAFVAKYTAAGALVYTTYLGGTGADVAYGIAVDSTNNNVYVTGSTSSVDFPTSAGAWSTTLKGSPNAFVTSLNAAGNGLVYSTYLGGSSTEVAFGIAVDSAHEATITGVTSSANFPTTNGALQTSFGGGNTDAFASRLNAAGTALVYSTFLGGTGDDGGNAVALDSQGKAYLTGYTGSANFPVTANVAQTVSGGDYDAFATAINATGTALVYSTYLGGSLEDYGFGVAVDSQQNAYVTGVTASANYLVTSGVFQGSSAGGYDGFVTKLSPAGALSWSTYIGGSGDDFSRAVAVDSNGNTYITGDTSSSNFPLTLSATQSTTAADFTTFVTEMNASGTGLSYSTYIGGSGFETAYGIALDSANAVWVVGYTVSPDFTVTAATAAQPALGGASDAFVIKFSGCGFALNSASATFSHTGGTGTVGVTALNSCSWSATSNSQWLTITSAATGTGTANVNYSVTANPGATPLSGSLTIAGLPFTVTETAPQTITFGPLSNVVLSTGAVTLNATSSSTLAVSFGSTTQAVCTVSGNIVTLIATGLCTITANQAGNASYDPATQVVQSFNIAVQNQTIAFGALSNVGIAASPITLHATASSGLPVGFASSTQNVCTVVAGVVTLLSAGTCTITASQAGSATYAAATPVVQSFNVAPAVQTITFNPLGAVSFGVTPFSISATASSNLTVAFSSTTQAVCTVSAAIVTIASAGTCSITASQSGNAEWSAATPVTQSFTVIKEAQTITFGALANAPFSSAPVNLTATASSGLAVSFASTTQAVCTVSGSAVMLVTTGTCSISATQAGNANYNAAIGVTQSFTVNPGTQTITFGPLSSIALNGSPITLSATASSGLPVSFASTTTSVCTVSGSTLTAVAAGTCSITASQAGNATYAPATPVVQSSNIGLTVQTITFGPLGAVSFGISPFSISATASSNLPVAFTSTTQAVCTVSAAMVTIVSAGTCSIMANQSGNAEWSAATPVTQSFTVNKEAQTITFGALANAAFSSGPVNLTATSSSGLAVSFASTTQAVCTVSASAVTLVTTGTCSISATQAGNANYNAAIGVTQSFTVNPGTQTITFGPLSSVTLPGSAITLSATASSGLPVSFASTTTSVCTVSGSTLTPVAAGACSITASQAGNANYAPAVSVNQSFTIYPASTGGSGSGGQGGGSGSGSGIGGGGGGGGGGAGGGGFVSPLTVSPATLTFNIAQSGNTATQTVTVTYVSQDEPLVDFGTSTQDSGVGWLQASPSSGAMTQTTFSGFPITFQTTITVSVNPAGLSSGTYTGSVIASASTMATAVPVTLTITQPAQLSITPRSLAFSYQTGSPALPSAQMISVSSQPSGTSFTVAASSNGNWLSAYSSSAKTPGAIAVSTDVSNLQPGTYTGQVTISSGSSNTTVPVSITVTPASPPQLSVSPLTQPLTAAQGGAPATGQVTVSNVGGGTLQFTAQATADQGNWLSLMGSGSGSATPFAPASLMFSADPTGLSPGLYTGHITLTNANSSNSATVNVILTVTSIGQWIELSQTGIAITAVSGGVQPQTQSLWVSNGGTGDLSWSAQAQQIPNPLSSATWLQVSPASGTATGGEPGAAVTVSANAAGLPAGVYYGSVSVTSSGASNSPQTVTVMLTVLSLTANPAISLTSGAFLLSGAAGSTTPLQQTLTVFNPSAGAINYSALVPPANSWLSISPASGAISPGPNSLSISANLSGLSAGVQSGTVQLTFADGSSATVQVILLVTGSGATGSARIGTLQPKAVAACSAGKPGFVIPILREPIGQSVVQVAAPQSVQAQVIDDCGSPVTASNGGAVQVSFSNNDPGLNLRDLGGGFWAGTWTPVNASSQVTLQIAASELSLAMNPALTAGATVTVTVNAATANSAAQPTGIANAASAAQAIPEVVAPGSYIAVYGTGLAGNGEPSATTLPLPTTLNGTQLLLGGIPMPLIYAGSGQVNAIVPQELAPNATYPLVVVRGSTQSVPVPLTVTALQPGIYTADTSGSGPGIVTNALTGQLVNASNPAHAGDYLTIYSTGLGPVSGANGEIEPGDGVAAPTNLLFAATANLSATVGSVPAQVTFAGLTPTLAALYQVNIQVPAGAPTGNAVPLVVTATDPQTNVATRSNVVTIAVE